MWRKADRDPHSYLAVGDMIMEKNEKGRMSVEVVNDEDITSQIAEGICVFMLNILISKYLK